MTDPGHPKSRRLPDPVPAGRRSSTRELIDVHRTALDHSLSVLELGPQLSARQKMLVQRARTDRLAVPASAELSLLLLDADPVWMGERALLASAEVMTMDGSEARASRRAERTGVPADLAVAVVEFGRDNGVCPALVARRLGELLTPWTNALHVGHGLGLGGLVLLGCLGSWPCERLTAEGAWAALDNEVLGPPEGLRAVPVAAGGLVPAGRRRGPRSIETFAPPAGEDWRAARRPPAKRRRRPRGED